MRRRPWDAELTAADHLRCLVGGVITFRDGHDQTPRDHTHDFDLKLDDGHVYAVEVTQAVNPKFQAQLSLASSLDWTFPSLRSSWIVWVKEGAAGLKRLHGSIVAILNHLDDIGAERYDRTDTTVSSEVHERVDRLGIRGAVRALDLDGPVVLLMPASRSISYGSSAPAGVVVDHTGRTDNRVKLGLAEEADERHLFVWVMSEMFEVTGAMSEPHLPSVTPDLRPEIDVVWLSTGFEPPTATWRYDRSGWSIAQRRR